VYVKITHSKGELLMKKANPKWRKSSYSAQGNCVEVAFASSGVMVRDSKDVDGPTLHFTAAQWSSLIASVHNGELRASTGNPTL
jgi:hypothetical protein